MVLSLLKQERSMNKTIRLAFAAVVALGATSAFATNGSTMIGVGAKALGMGGAGIGVGHGAESALANPANITTIKKDNEFSIGGTLFMPQIKYKADGMAGTGGVQEKSDADFFVVPSVSMASKLDDNWYIGVGMWGTGGLGVDYRDYDTHMNMRTALQNMQFGVPIAYTTDGFSIGVTPIIQYTSLDINYDSTGMGGGQVGSGVADDVRIGYNLGVAYKMDELSVGAVYKSKIKADIQDVLVNAIGAMGAAYNNTKISSPAELGFGASYSIDGHTIALDYKRIYWEDAETYKDFGWRDQNVFALGYEYADESWALRVGYEYAKSAVRDNSGKNLALDNGMFGPGLTNMFNALGFPGTQESHITVGGTYNFTDMVSVDLAVVQGLSKKKTMPILMGSEAEVKHSETGVSIQLNYAF